MCVCVRLRCLFVCVWFVRLSCCLVGAFAVLCCDWFAWFVRLVVQCVCLGSLCVCVCCVVRMLAYAFVCLHVLALCRFDCLFVVCWLPVFLLMLLVVCCCSCSCSCLLFLFFLLLFLLFLLLCVVVRVVVCCCLSW